MSSAIQFLKRIDGYTPEIALNSFQRAAAKADMYCFGFDILSFSFSCTRNHADSSGSR